MNDRVRELERIALDYHLNESVPDKFIEDLCQQHCCEWLATLIRPEMRVCELGVGDGVTLSRLAPVASAYCVVEASSTLVERARREHPAVEVIHSLFEDYRPVQGFDRLFALHVLEHVEDPVSLTRHLSQWLAPDAELIVVVPNRNSLHRRLAVLMGLQPELDTLSARDRLVGHLRVYGLQELRADLDAAGFEVIEERGFFLKSLPNSMMLDHTPELIRAMNKLGDQLPADYQANLAIRARVRSNPGA
jgi:2-polyprenyl-3-methyl-5-hydroxy-6-metoxy-1,4-benzoquinol methylase